MAAMEVLRGVASIRVLTAKGKQGKWEFINFLNFAKYRENTRNLYIIQGKTGKLYMISFF